MANIQQRVSRHREKLRAQGLRPVQFWVPDVRTAEFAELAHRQSIVIATSNNEPEDQAFVDALAVDWSNEG
ncbi:MAG: antitoxin MazE family protein [Angustibacter sp.]